MPQLTSTSLIDQVAFLSVSHKWKYHESSQVPSDAEQLDTLLPQSTTSSTMESPNEPTAQFLTLARPLINEKDSFENAEEWILLIRSGNYTVKSFQKLLPNTAKDISQGHLNHEMVGFSLVSNYVWITNRVDTTRLRCLSSVVAEFILPSTASAVVRECCPVQVGHMIYCSPFLEGTPTAIESFLPELIKGLRAFYITDVGMDFMAQQLGRISPRDSSSLKLPEVDFVNAVLVKLGDIDTAELRREYEEARRITEAVLQITIRFHSIFYECWECSKVVGNIFCCGGCNTAAYCSQKCQKVAWKGGHKTKCKRLETMHELCRAGVEEHKKAQLKAMREGFKLCSMTDVRVMNYCLRCIAQKLDRTPLERSMKIYYQNLGRIFRGEWWVYDMSDQAECSYSADDTNEPKENKISFTLAIDWFDRARKRIGTDDPQKVMEWVDPVFRELCGAPISVEAFLESYGSPDSDGPARADFTVSSYKNLRYWYGEML